MLVFIGLSNECFGFLFFLVLCWDSTFVFVFLVLWFLLVLFFVFGVFLFFLGGFMVVLLCFVCVFGRFFWLLFWLG